jgi:hypothetical protein
LKPLKTKAVAAMLRKQSTWPSPEPSPAQPYRVPRGVWRAPWTDEAGREILVAVDSRGRCIHRATVFPRDDREAVGRMLQRLLDAEDAIWA